MISTKMLLMHILLLACPGALPDSTQIRRYVVDTTFHCGEWRGLVPAECAENIPGLLVVHDFFQAGSHSFCLMIDYA